LGANASPLAFGELYSALQQNTYDGMDNSLSLIDSSKFYEVQEYMTVTNHQYSGLIIMINDQLLNDMPDDLQDVITDAGEVTEEEYYELVDEDEENIVDQFVEEDLIEITELSSEQRDEFIEATESVYDKYADVIGQDLIDLARSYSEE